MAERRICHRLEELFSTSETWDQTSPVPGNQLSVLVSGEQVYPAMISAIEEARDRVFLSMYQFDDDEIGSRFAEVLGSASRRGVEVRVILDAWGDVKSHPSVRSHLLRLGIDVKRFHGLSSVRGWNRRYHRKLLLIDGKVGFTGGMNIRNKHLVETYSGVPMRDTVFRISGPVLAHLESVFLIDWLYCGGQDDFRPSSGGEEVGSEDVFVLGAGAPFRRQGLLDEYCETIGRVSQRRVAVLTPFFFPGKRLLEALKRAAERGVAVDLVLPSGDFKFLGWCALALVEELVECGCNAFLSPPPYDHSKILVVDDAVYIGTVNLDVRSFQFNWEIAMICRGGSLLAEVEDIVEEQKASRVGPAELRSGFVERLARRFVLSTVGRFF